MSHQSGSSSRSIPPPSGAGSLVATPSGIGHEVCCPGLPARSLAGDPLLQQKYRDLIHRHLGKFLSTLYAEFTGLHFHIAWPSALPGRWDARTLPTGSSVCCRLSRCGQPRDCRTCGAKRLARALCSGERGHHFTCRHGVCNFWIPIRVRSQTLGVAYVQAQQDAAARARAGHGAEAGRRHAGKRVRSRPKFAQAARFLRHIVQHVQTASLAELSREDLTQAQQALRIFETVQARLREALNGVVPMVRKTPPCLRPVSRPERIVSAVLDHISQDYSRPITLSQCAARLGLNAAYLSHLFSQQVGLRFKTYLLEVRLEKARELLSNPAVNISQVAAAVGYASDNRFRIAFKKATGLSPNQWRSALQMSPPGPFAASGPTVGGSSSLAHDACARRP